MRNFEDQSTINNKVEDREAEKYTAEEVGNIRANVQQLLEKNGVSRESVDTTKLGISTLRSIAPEYVDNILLCRQEAANDNISRRDKFAQDLIESHGKKVAGTVMYIMKELGVDSYGENRAENADFGITIGTNEMSIWSKSDKSNKAAMLDSVKGFRNTYKHANEHNYTVKFLDDGDYEITDMNNIPVSIGDVLKNRNHREAA